MADAIGTVKADILIQIQDSPIEPCNVGTIEMPLRAESVGDGVVNCILDTSAFERFGQAFAAAMARVRVEVEAETADAQAGLTHHAH